MNCLLTCLTLNLLLAALFIAVEFHILPKDSEATSKRAWLEDFLTRANMLNCFLVAINTVAGVIGALELHLHHVLFHSSVHFSPIDLVVTKALLWATFIFLCPRCDTRGTEYGLTSTALKRLLDHIGTDRAAEKVSSLLLALVNVDKAGHVKFTFTIHKVIKWLWNI
jgi:hypothetical protein